MKSFRFSALFFCLIYLVPHLAATILDFGWSGYCATGPVQSGTQYFIEAYGAFDDYGYVDLDADEGYYYGDTYDQYATNGQSFTHTGNGAWDYCAIIVDNEDMNGAEYIYRTIQVYEPNHAPGGCFDSVTDASKGYNIVAGGWAVDYEMGAPVDHVDFYIDGNYAGQASLGGYRPDVQNANVNGGNWSPKDLTYSGWNITYNTAGLDYGDHTIHVIAYDNQGASGDIGTKTFSVVDYAPHGCFDAANNASKGQNMTASGWAVDYEMGAPVDHVDFYIDGNYAGQASLGGYRPDIQDANVNWGYWSPNDVTWSGWNVTYNTGGLSVGDHTMRVIVYDNHGQSEDIGTKTFTVTPASQSISFGNPGTQTYGTPLTLNASASSGLSVSYSVSGPAYLSGNTVYFTGTGTVSITASQAGDSNYSAASDVAQSFTVNPQPVSFSITNTGFTYDGQSHGPSITPSQGGASYVLGGTTSAVSAGSYTITATATGNYSGSASSSWSINQQGQSISFGNPGSQTYATSLNLNASASSGLPISYSVSGPASLSGSTVTFTGTGTVTITASQSGNQNYSAAANVSQSFTVNPVATTFSLGNTSFTYNGSAQGPSVVVSPSGATYTVNGPLSATTVGTYNVTVTATGNYSGSATLSWNIASTAQTITFNPIADQTFGDTLTLNATASSGLPVSYSVSQGSASVSGNVVTFTGTGTVTITASQAGNANYGSASTVSCSFTVNARPATFALSSTGFTYNGSAQGPSVVASPSNATYAVSGTLSATGGGTYTATITGTGNYTGSSTLTWTIAKANQSITFANPGTQQAGIPLTLGATASSGLAVSYSASGPVSLSGNTATFTKGGTATITASQVGDANFNAATSVGVSFTVLSDPNADDDNDGLSNRLEKILGTDPNHAATTDTSGAFKVHKP